MRKERLDRKFITVVLTAVLLMMLGACTSEEGAAASMGQETGGMTEKTTPSGNQTEASETSARRQCSRTHRRWISSWKTIILSRR